MCWKLTLQNFTSSRRTIHHPGAPVPVRADLSITICIRIGEVLLHHHHHHHWRNCQQQRPSLWLRRGVVVVVEWDWICDGYQMLGYWLCWCCSGKVQYSSQSLKPITTLSLHNGNRTNTRWRARASTGSPVAQLEGDDDEEDVYLSICLLV